MNGCNGIPPAVMPWVIGYPYWNDFSNTVPQLYWNVTSTEQRYHLLCKNLHKLACYADMLAGKINLDHADIVELQEQFQKFMDSGFDDYYFEQIEQWVNDHLETLYHLLVKQVFFGLNEQGYFVAYIPESWEDIVFDTDMDYSSEYYGHLILEYQVNNESETVNQP